ERVAVVGRVASGGWFALVPVGALNVGSIALSFAPLSTNAGRSRVPHDVDVEDDRPVRRSDEAARFRFGRAIVLPLPGDPGALDEIQPGYVLRLGRRIGTLHEPFASGTNRATTRVAPTG